MKMRLVGLLLLSFSAWAATENAGPYIPRHGVDQALSDVDHAMKEARKLPPESPPQFYQLQSDEDVIPTTGSYQNLELKNGEIQSVPAEKN